MSENTGYRPAQGLLRLTWPQLEEIDRLIDLVCQATAETGGEGRLTLVIKNGKLRFIDHPLVRTELKPNRD